MSADLTVQVGADLLGVFYILQLIWLGAARLEEKREF